jgi:hypothetical protein
MLKARANLVDKFGVPETVPDTPAATPTNTEIDDLLLKYGVTGQTGATTQGIPLEQSEMLHRTP